MPASRTCQKCGAPLPTDVRWCGLCHEPVREFTPRAAIWAPGEFVDNPIHTSGPIAHWSRWEKSATTLGPIGRCLVTLFTVMWILGAGTRSSLTLLFVLPISIIVLRDVWKPGWVLPGRELQRGSLRDLIPQGPVSSWLFDREELRRTIIGAVIALVFVGLLFNGDDVVRFATIATGVVAGCYAFFRVYFNRY
jgi:hypothetical protein